MMSPAAGRAVAELITNNSSNSGVSSSSNVISSNSGGGGGSNDIMRGSDGSGSKSGGSNTLVYDTIDLNNFSFARILSGHPYLETNII